ncbi:MAG: hypothetical protein Q8K45_15715 [Rubrivivax sp.]|nr:hypothetical protein [Rubrivivax sp.]
MAQRGEPEYPFAPWKRGEGGRVWVELVFAGTELAPAVEVIESQGDDALVKAVKAHVATFRTPCAEAGDLPVRLRQEYVFLPDKRKAVWTAPADEADAARRRVLKCMAANDGSKNPEYPVWARRDEVQGNLLARLRFTSPELPPQVTAHAASRRMKNLAEDAVLPWTDKLRLPCMEGAAVDAIYTFIFRLEGARPAGFRQIGFLQFLRGAKNLEQPGAAFDTNAMGCPFEVRLQYLQPYFPNRLGQLGEPVPTRQALLDWLSTLELDLKPAQQDAVLGDTATLTVPCVKLNLTPKEKTS